MHIGLDEREIPDATKSRRDDQSAVQDVVRLAVEARGHMTTL
jgi:hypothetical protein